METTLESEMTRDQLITVNESPMGSRKDDLGQGRMTARGKENYTLKCLWIAGEKITKVFLDCSLLASPISYLFGNCNLQ